MRPLIHDLEGRRVVVFGGGSVGERKARFFEGEADLTVVSREFTEGLEGMDAVLVRADAAEVFERFVDDAFLVVPATSDEDLNRRIGEIASEKGALVNDVSGGGDVVVPSVVDFDEFLVAISTLGKSPATSKFIRKRVQDLLGDEFSGMVEVQRRARDMLKEKVEEQGERARLLNELVGDEEVWGHLREGETEEAWERGKEVIDSAV